MQKISLIASVCALTIAIIAGQVDAAQITFNGFGYERMVSFEHNGSTMEVRAGEFLIDVDGTDEIAYCVDLDHRLKPEWEADFASVGMINGGLAVAYLYDHFADTISSNVEAAGLQVAICKVVDDYGSGLDLWSGAFRMTGPGGVADMAENYLSTLPDDLSGYVTSSYILDSGDSPRSQNLIVPEPATLALIGLGCIPVVWRKRR